MKRRNIVLHCLLSMWPIVMMVGCAGGENVQLGPQQWRDMQIVVETRPSPITKGMNEFIVIVSREKNKPGVGLIVSLQIDRQQEWRQAIQDGYTGVYRRAIRVNDPLNDVLAINLHNTKAGEGDEKETTLYFPLNQGR